MLFRDFFYLVVTLVIHTYYIWVKKERKKEKNLGKECSCVKYRINQDLLSYRSNHTQESQFSHGDRIFGLHYLTRFPRAEATFPLSIWSGTKPSYVVNIVGFGSLWGERE